MFETTITSAMIDTLIFFERWYLEFGYLDRYFELIFKGGVDPVVWSDIDTPIYIGMINRDSGFTTHPRFLELAEAYGLVELWDKRGPPDFCEKLGGQWVCE